MTYAYLKKKDDMTAVLSGFEHVRDTLYVYVSPTDRKLVLNTKSRDSQNITAFPIVNSEIKSKELVKLIEDMDGFDKNMLYNEKDESYYISSL